MIVNFYQMTYLFAFVITIVMAKTSTDPRFLRHNINDELL